MRIVGPALFTALFIALTCRIDVLSSQQPPTSPMLPSEVLTYSTAPFVATRAQPDDMTQADLFAFSIGVARAGQGCHDLESTNWRPLQTSFSPWQDYATLEDSTTSLAAPPNVIFR